MWCAVVEMGWVVDVLCVVCDEDVGRAVVFEVCFIVESCDTVEGKICCTLDIWCIVDVVVWCGADIEKMDLIKWVWLAKLATVNI